MLRREDETLFHGELRHLTGGYIPAVSLLTASFLQPHFFRVSVGLFECEHDVFMMILICVTPVHAVIYLSPHSNISEA